MQNRGGRGFTNAHLRLSLTGLEIQQSHAQKGLSHEVAFESHAALGAVAYQRRLLGYLQLNSAVKASHRFCFLKGEATPVGFESPNRSAGLSKGEFLASYVRHRWKVCTRTYSNVRLRTEVS